MAAALFAEQLRERGLGDAVRVSSAGTAACMGDGADEQACAVLGQHGYPVPTDHRAVLVGDEHLGADLVVALGREHVGVLQACGVNGDRLTYVDVRNPLFGADFEDAFTAIEAAMPGLHHWLDRRLTSPSFGRLETAVGFRFWTGISGDVLGLRTTHTSRGRRNGPTPDAPTRSTCRRRWGATAAGTPISGSSTSIARARGFPAAAQAASRLGVVDPPWSYLVVGKVLCSTCSRTDHRLR